MTLRPATEITDDRAAQVVTTDDLVAWFRRFAEVVEGRADELSSLDAAIGDADHGTNLRRGARAVLLALDAERPSDVAGFGRTVAMQLISAVGGASGPLYGSFFLALGTSGGTQGALSPTGFAAAVRAGVDGVAARGKASAGDKTMLDALLPAVSALEEATASGAPLRTALQAAVDAAETGMLATIPMVARKGRASYLGERSAGHQDPGATSSSLLVRAAAQTLDVTDRGA
nr:dihydroxyacetone kinase subunit DhaL [Nitriliruptor alkaliphilus]